MEDTGEFQSWLPWSRLSPRHPPPTQQQPIMWLVLNLRFEDSWSVTSAAFNRTLISSQISNHYGTSLTLVAPPGKRLFSRFKTVFTTSGDKRVLASCTKLSMTPSCICDLLTCPHKFKTERYRGGVRQFHCFLSMSEEFMKEEPLAGLAVKAWFLPSLLFIALFCSDCNWSQSQMQNGTFPKSCVCQDLIEDPFKEAQWMVTVRTLRLLANAARQLKGRLKMPPVRGFQDGGARFKLRANRSAIKCQLPRYLSHYIAI